MTIVINNSTPNNINPVKIQYYNNMTCTAWYYNIISRTTVAGNRGGGGGDGFSARAVPIYLICSPLSRAAPPPPPVPRILIFAPVRRPPNRFGPGKATAMRAWWPAVRAVGHATLTRCWSVGGRVDGLTGGW